MKTKCLLPILVIGLIVNSFGQKPTMELTFTANNNGLYVPIDSIIIENITQNGDTTLYAPDTILMIDYVSGIGDSEAVGENSFSVSQNYPNPFKGKTEVKLYLPEREFIRINVRDIIGRELVYYENTLSQGNHSFDFYAGNEKYYLLTVTGSETNKTIKMLNANSGTTPGGDCRIVYDKYDANVIGFKTQDAINIFKFNLGDELRYTAYTDILERSIVNSPTVNQTYTIQYSIGVSCSGTPTLTDVDGNIYNTVQIGSQCWMAENLKTTTYRNNTPIPNITDSTEWLYLTTGAYVWYDNDISWKDLYGALYNWYTVDDLNGLCPEGWHVPADDEWTVLTDFIGGTGSPHGNELKSSRQVDSPLGGGCNTSEQPRWNQDNTFYGTDHYGFSGLPGGYRFGYGPFDHMGNFGFWWSSTEHSLSYSWYRSLGYDIGNVYEYRYYKHYGFSVRCLKD